MKKSYYFPHDYHARHDPKLEKLRIEIGPIGDGIYWDLVEMLYEQDGYLPIKDINAIAKMLNTNEELIKKVVMSSELFMQNGDFFYSESLLNRLKHINAKRRKAKTSANNRWYANAMRTQCERNAIKESKVKESKVNNIEREARPHSIEAVIKYFLEIKSSAHEAHKFFDHFTSNGWKVGGKAPMKDWKASARNWTRNDAFRKPEKKIESKKYEDFTHTKPPERPVVDKEGLEKINILVRGVTKKCAELKG